MVGASQICALFDKTVPLFVPTTEVNLNIHDHQGQGQYHACSAVAMVMSVTMTTAGMMLTTIMSMALCKKDVTPVR